MGRIEEKMERLICIAIGYVFGLFQTSYIYGKMHGIDIRKCGSGNAGTTNMLRTMGTKAGAITLLGDAFKCVIAVLVVRTLFRAQYEEILPLLSIYTAAGVILGHNFPFYMKFKGGKGVASTFGFILVTCWPVAVIALGIWLVMAFAFRYSSLSALTAAVFVPVASYFLAPSLEYTVVYALVVLLVIVRHHGNIRRLLNGEESKIKLKKQ